MSIGAFRRPHDSGCFLMLMRAGVRQARWHSSGALPLVIPAKAGIHVPDQAHKWIPAFAGMTNTVLRV
jgi:hypothetical protein